MKLIIKKNVKMEKLTSYKLKGIVSTVIYPKTQESLIDTIKYFNKNNIKYKVLGNGTNIIFSNENYKGIIIKLTKIKYKIINKNNIIVSSGYSILQFINEMIDMSLSSLEFAYGIPGSIGGSVYGNAGCHGKSIGEKIISVEVLENGLIKTYKNEDIHFNYRDSIFKHKKDIIILSCKFSYTKKDKNLMKKEVSEYLEKRKSTQPLEYPNAGSVFKNPLNDSAGRIIDSLNLKNTNVKDAYISNKHANFIINKGNSSGKDIITLIKKVQNEVMNKTGIHLFLEQEIID